MSVEYRIENKYDYCRLYVSGEWTRGQEANEAKKIWEELMEVSKQTEISRVIAVFDIPGSCPQWKPSRSQVLLYPPAGGTIVGRLPWFYPYPERYESNLFSETVAVNRGYNVKAFRNESDALAWLGIKSTDQPSAQ